MPLERYRLRRPLLGSVPAAPGKTSSAVFATKYLGRMFWSGFAANQVRLTAAIPRLSGRGRRSANGSSRPTAVDPARHLNVCFGVAATNRLNGCVGCKSPLDRPHPLRPLSQHSGPTIWVPNVWFYPLVGGLTSTSLRPIPPDRGQ